MTDRYSGFVVSLEKDIREDDAQATIAAIQQIKGVIGVQPVVGDAGQLIEASRIRRSVLEILRDAEQKIMTGAL